MHGKKHASMKFNTKVAVATYVTFLGLVVLSVVLIVVLTRTDAAAPSVSVVTRRRT